MGRLWSQSDLSYLWKSVRVYVQDINRLSCITNMPTCTNDLRRSKCWYQDYPTRLSPLSRDTLNKHLLTRQDVQCLSGRSLSGSIFLPEDTTRAISAPTAWNQMTQAVGVAVDISWHSDVYGGVGVVLECIQSKHQLGWGTEKGIIRARNDYFISFKFF